MDASVGFLLENLKSLVLYQADLIGNAKHELDGLTDDLGRFKAILEDACRKSKKDELFQQWERRIRDAVYDIEDTIDGCVTKASAAGNKTWIVKLVDSFKTGALAEEVRTLRKYKVRPLMDEFHSANLNIIAHHIPDNVQDDATKIRQQKSKHIVGFEEETNLFVDLLTRESDKLEITSIIGMPGLGKTTLAWKIFEHQTIGYEFNILLWVNVSDTPNIRKILMDIIFKLTTSKPDSSLTNEQLITQVQDRLDGKKFFIVLDDVWTVGAWTELSAFFPPDNKWGKVLITTRNTLVGKNSAMNPLHAHDLRLLNDDESWELLQYQVFGKLGDMPQELQRVGKDIADDCKGLPLSIVVIGGILNEKTSGAGDNITAIETEWNEVSKRMKTYLAGKDVLTNIISLSYDKLPYELRNSFLYLGVFPEDADIPVKKLIRLWIAEGFVQERPPMSMEEVALDNLKSLINRNLVMVRVEKHDGEPKICHIHDTIREICKREGNNLNLFQEICEGKLPANSETSRRLSIHSDAIDFFSKNPKVLKARSFLSSKESSALEGTGLTSITNAFALLRVYDAKDMKFQRFPAKFFQQLIHLRYLTLAVASELKILPEAVTNLWNLQTLIVDTPSQTLEIKGDVWKMRHLRHFVTQASIILKKKAGSDQGGEKLQTLSRLSPESCTNEVCKRAKSLITLGIQGDIGELGDSEFLGQLDSLMKLKLVHQVRRGAANNPLRRIHNFPINLEILVLSGTRLNWSSMATFSNIFLLKVLKLKENAFQGSTWEVSGNKFGHLFCLHIERADLKYWEDKNDHFPKLRFLTINSCDKLKEIPLTLGKQLEVLTMERVTPAAVNCAEIIEKEQKKKGRVVKLNIAAADRT